MFLFITKHRRFSLTTLWQLFSRKLSLYFVRAVASVCSCHDEIASNRREIRKSGKRASSAKLVEFFGLGRFSRKGKLARPRGSRGWKFAQIGNAIFRQRGRQHRRAYAREEESPLMQIGAWRRYAYTRSIFRCRNKLSDRSVDEKAPMIRAVPYITLRSEVLLDSPSRNREKTTLNSTFVLASSKIESSENGANVRALKGF